MSVVLSAVPALGVGDEARTKKTNRMKIVGN